MAKKPSQRYHIGALIKIVLGVIIGLLLYMFISPQEDPMVAIGGLLVALFLVGRGVSFYMFMFVNVLAKRTPDETMSDSYKMSLLFGFFVIINATLIFLQSRTKLLGALLLMAFMALFVMLFRQRNQRKHDR